MADWVNGTKILARLADRGLFAVPWAKTHREAAIGAPRALETVFAPIAGLVLAHADHRRPQDYSYGYASYYSYRKYCAD